MVVAEQEPTGDEEADFADMLRKFKQGVAENVDPEDYQSHYDLAIAYKEMGLLDEAIAEFQKALGESDRIVCRRTRRSASASSRRAIQARGVDSQSRARTSRRRTISSSACSTCSAAPPRRRGAPSEALGYYQRVFVVDIQFRDIADRMSEVERAAR